MNILYHIDNLCPRTDINMGRCGFSVNLFPAWREAVAESKLTQQRVNTAVQNLGRMWLDGCGYNRMYDPDAVDPMAAWEEKHLGKPVKLGPNARHLYGPESIRVGWGEWGTEHISVPGDACGLDIDNGIRSPKGGRVLVPHNVDSISQAHLLLVVFTWFAGGFILDWEMKEMKA